MTNTPKADMSDDNKREIESCPFCAGHSVACPLTRTVWHVYCTECEAAGPLRGSRAEAIAAWNRRAASAQAEPAAESEAEKACEAAWWEADAHLRAVLHYTEHFYGVAIEHGMKAGPTANAIAHVESAAKGLHRLARTWAEIAQHRAARTSPSAGLVLVPREPTEAMVSKAMRECGGIGGGCYGEHTGVDGDDLRSVWEAMIEAAQPEATIVKDKP